MKLDSYLHVSDSAVFDCLQQRFILVHIAKDMLIKAQIEITLLYFSFAQFLNEYTSVFPIADIAYLALWIEDTQYH